MSTFLLMRLSMQPRSTGLHYPIRLDGASRSRCLSRLPEQSRLPELSCGSSSETNPHCRFCRKARDRKQEREGVIVTSPNYALACEAEAGRTGHRDLVA